MAKAKKTTSAATSTASEKKGGGLVSLVIAVLLVTTIAGGLGFLTGHTMRKELIPETTVAQRLTTAKVDTDVLQIVSLPSIVTNLAGSDGGWIRIETAVVVDGKKPIGADLASKLAQDTTALLRTLSIRQITGASGFQHLREELLDRMRTRSADRVRDVIIQSLVIE